MQVEGADLTGAERAAVAAFITGGTTSADATDPGAGACTTTPPFSDPFGGPHWTGWGAGPDNLRYQTAEHAGLTVGQVPDLTLQWAVGFADATQMYSQPAVAGGRLFIGSQDGTVYALDARSGCRHWSYAAQAGVRTAISIGALEGADEFALYFGDIDANVYAIDAATGAELWTTEVDPHPVARVTGAPTLHDGRLYVTVSSIEEAAAANPAYACCTFRGSVLALDPATGDRLWKTFVIPDNAGQAGAAIWSSPTIDATRGLLYAATGNAYTQPAAATSDSIMAFDLESGAIRWTIQLTPDDAFIIGCQGSNPNCPEDAGPDYDFGSSPSLVTMSNGVDLLVIGQKSGVAYGLDPEREGAIVWQHQAGAGSALGGIEWGFAVDGDKAYFAVSDVITPEPGGLSAVRLRTGELVWYADAPVPLCAEGENALRPGFMTGCTAAQSAAITAIPGVIFSGSLDGGLRAYSAETGEIIWTYDANGEFETVNGVPAHGGSINAAGPVVVDGMVYVNVGYEFLGSRAGNVLLAFGVE